MPVQLFTFVLGEMERDAPHGVPNRVATPRIVPVARVICAAAAVITALAGKTSAQGHHIAAAVGHFGRPGAAATDAARGTK